MSQYIAIRKGIQIAQIADDIDIHPAVMQTVRVWLQSGFTVQITGGTMTTTPTYTAPRAVKPAARRTKRVTAPAPEPPITEWDGWTLGATCYLRWKALDQDRRIHLSQYLTTPGQIVEFRRATERQIAVRFNSNPDVIWLNSFEIHPWPEVG